MSEETIVAVYDSSAQADAAIQDLAAAHVPSGAINRHSSTMGTPAPATGGPETTSQREPGFWSSLFGGESTRDAATFNRSIESGSEVVTVRVPEEHAAAVSRILESHNPIDIDERTSGYETGVAGTTTTTTAAVSAPPAAPATTLQGGEERLQLAEEQLKVGKRLVNRGTTRIRRFVVETPVEENVTLHSEHVSVERRPVEGVARVADADFTDKVIEMTETQEEAVVAKNAHVKEEVVIRKDATDRVETIHDTVRREDVEITKDTPTATGSTPGTVPPVRR